MRLTCSCVTLSKKWRRVGIVTRMFFFFLGRINVLCMLLTELGVIDMLTWLTQLTLATMGENFPCSMLQTSSSVTVNKAKV